MYRIIGVFPDSNGDEYVKLIKFSHIKSYTSWSPGDDEESPVSWENSFPYKMIYGSDFLSSTDYDYMQNNSWLNKITNWKWNLINTNTSVDTTNNISYTDTTSTGIYYSEMNINSLDKLCTSQDEISVSCNVGEHSTFLGKIGLMYVSDYTLSLGSDALQLKYSTDSDLLNKNWMQYQNNFPEKKEYEDWSISAGWIVAPNVIYAGSLPILSYLRPSFYLNSSVKLNTSSGDGSLSNPYIIEE